MPHIAAQDAPTFQLPGTTFTCSAQELTGRTLTVSIKVLSSDRYELVDATETTAG